MKGYVFSAALGIALLAGCDGTPSSPSEELPSQELTRLASQSSQLGATMLDQATFTTGWPGRGGPDGEFSLTRPCPAGGEMRVAGSSKTTGDRASGTFSTQHTATRTLAACAFQTRDGVLVKQDGKVTIAGTRNVVNRQLSGPQTTTEKGSITWERGTARRTCEIDLTSTLDPATKKVTTSGTMCGRTVDSTHTVGADRPRG